MIRAGIGGWTFAPWRGTFYPPKLKHAEELAYASRHVTAIEVNGTFYRTQTPATFAKWRSEAPDDFVFCIKAPAAAVNRKVLAEGGASIERFFDSGVTELGPKLGPILWQLAPTKKFDPDDIAAFLALLPDERDGVAFQHAIEARHPSFEDAAFVDLCRKRGAAIVYADADKYPAIADCTAGFVYARLQRGTDEAPQCYPPAALDEWAARARTWAAGDCPDDLPRVAPGAAPAGGGTRQVYVFFIHNGKVNAPAGAMALLERLGGEGA